MRELKEQMALQATSSYFKNLKITEKDCRRVTLYFDRVTQFNSRPVARFKLYRDGVLVNTVTPNASKGASIPFSVGDGWFVPGDGANHSYYVIVENDRGQTGQSATLTHRANACPSIGQSFVIVKLTPSDLAPYSEIAADNRVKNLFASTSSQTSLYSYFKEVSYGKVSLSFVEEPGWLDVGMTHREYCSGSANIQTASNGKKYCASGFAKMAQGESLYESSMAAKYPGKKIIWVHNGVRAGYGGYNADISYGALEISDGDQRGVMHELGHYFDLTEGWGLRCPSSAGWFGPSLTGIPGPTPPSGCYFAQYAYAFDPMGGRSGHHFYGMHKYQMGWLNAARNVKKQTAVSTGRAALMTLKAVDDPTLSTSTQFSDYRLGRYQIETNGIGYFMLEYRRNVGMNAVSYPSQPALTNGIYMTYFPGRNPTTRTYEDDDMGGIHGDLLVPLPQNTNAEPVITAGNPYVDPDRQLRITLESIDGANAKATVKIHKAYAYTGSCVTTKDTRNYVSAGYPCFCNRQIGAFVDKTSTTVECRAGVTPTR